MSAASGVSHPSVGRPSFAQDRSAVNFWNMLQSTVSRWLTPKRAAFVAMALFVVASLGDVITTDETLFYLVPLWIAVWYVNIQTGYLIAALSVLSGITVDWLAGTRSHGLYFIIWNNLVDGVLFVVFARILAALRAQVETESELRMEALNQLRHAERLNTIGKLASGIAHEIGTPLNVISGHAELILMGRVGPGELRSTGQVLLEQSERVTSIMRQLLDFSRRGGTQVVPTDIGDLAQVTVQLLRTLAKKSGVEIVCRGEPIQAPVNRSEIQQVISNLVTNAIQAMPNGGRIEVNVRRERMQTKKAAAHAGDYVVIEVADNGTGIPAHVLPKIFDPFFTTKEVGQGTGLGLSVAYGIVKDHQGWVAVESEVGTGAKFAVYLPQIPAPSSRSSQEP